MKEPLQIALALFFAALPVCRGGAQETVPPPPQLAVTMQFIQEKLEERGTVNYAVQIHDNAGGSHWMNRFSTTDTNVVADPAACRISFHEKRTMDGGVTFDGNYQFSLHNLQEVATMPLEQVLNQRDTAEGHPTWDARIDPPVTVLVARQKATWDWYFYFFDQDMAGRVATAMNHAVVLCGRGK